MQSEKLTVSSVKRDGEIRPVIYEYFDRRLNKKGKKRDEEK